MLIVEFGLICLIADVSPKKTSSSKFIPPKYGKLLSFVIQSSP